MTITIVEYHVTLLLMGVANEMLFVVFACPYKQNTQLSHALFLVNPSVL